MYLVRRTVGGEVPEGKRQRRGKFLGQGLAPGMLVRVFPVEQGQRGAGGFLARVFPQISGPKAKVYARLRPKSLEVLKMLAMGKTVKEIGLELGRCSKTVEWHRAQLYRATGADSEVGLVRFMIDAGVFE